MDWIYTRSTEHDMQAEFSDPLLIRKGFTAAINVVQYLKRNTQSSTDQIDHI